MTHQAGAGDALPVLHGEQAGPVEGVILLHGLARTRFSMWPLARFLARQEFVVVNPGYPSRRHAIEILAHQTLPRAVEALRRQGVDRIHGVSHSMGGLLLRAYLAEGVPPDWGRIVMLCPPNQGSELADRLRHWPLFRLIFGPAGCQLGIAAEDLPQRLGPAPCPVGILTGNRSGPLAARFFPGPNDGKVAVARARLAGMRDFLVVHHGHSLIMHHGRVQEQVAHFLRFGRFDRPDSEQAARG
ncbi:MAG: esterase/lipase family protein [Desulfobulbus sp.]